MLGGWGREAREIANGFAKKRAHLQQWKTDQKDLTLIQYSIIKTTKKYFFSHYG